MAECNIKCRYCDAWFETADASARHIIQFHKNVKELSSSSHQRMVAESQWRQRNYAPHLKTNMYVDTNCDSPISSHEYVSPNNSSSSSGGTYTKAKIVHDYQSKRPPCPLPVGCHTSTEHGWVFYTGPTAAQRGLGNTDQTTAHRGLGNTDQTTAHRGLGSTDQTTAHRGLGNTGPTTAHRGLGNTGPTTAHRGLGNTDQTTAHRGLGNTDQTTAHRGLGNTDQTTAHRGLGNTGPTTAHRGLGNTDQTTAHRGLGNTGPTTAHRGLGNTGPTTAHRGLGNTDQTTAHRGLGNTDQTTAHRGLGNTDQTTAHRGLGNTGPTTAHRGLGNTDQTTAHRGLGNTGPTTAHRGLGNTDQTTAHPWLVNTDPTTQQTTQAKRKENTKTKPPKIWKGCIAALAILVVIVVLAGSVGMFTFKCEILKISCHKDKPSESICNTTQSAEYGTTSAFVCVVPLEGPTAIALRQTSPRPDVPDVVVAKPIDGTKAQVIQIRDNVQVNVAITAKEVELTVHLVDTTCLQTGNFTVTISNQTNAVTSRVNINLDESGAFYCPCTVPGDLGDHKNVQCKLEGDLNTNIGVKRKTEKSEEEELLALVTIRQLLQSGGTIAVDSMNSLFLDMVQVKDSYSFSLRFLSVQCSVEGLYVIVFDSKRFETYLNVEGEGETMVPTFRTYSLPDNRQGIIADFNIEPYQATIQCTANTICASGELKLYQFNTVTNEYESIESTSITQSTNYKGDLRTVVLTQTLTKTDVESILEKDKYIITCKFTDSMGIENMSEDFQVRVIRGDLCTGSNISPGCNTFHPYDCAKFIQCTDDSLHEADCVTGSGLNYWTNNTSPCHGACVNATPADKPRCG